MRTLIVMVFLVLVNSVSGIETPKTEDIKVDIWSEKGTYTNTQTHVVLTNTTVEVFVLKFNTAYFTNVTLQVSSDLSSAANWRPLRSNEIARSAMILPTTNGWRTIKFFNASQKRLFGKGYSDDQ